MLGTSTQLINAFTKNWDKEIINTLGLNLAMFQDIKMPKETLASLRKELVEEFGFDMDVILPATHDTGSAVLAVPELEDTKKSMSNGVLMLKKSLKN